MVPLLVLVWPDIERCMIVRMVTDDLGTRLMEERSWTFSLLQEPTIEPIVVKNYTKLYHCISARLLYRL